MTRRLSMLVGLPMAVMAVSGAYAADNADLKAVLQTRYAAMKTAMAAHDGQAIAAILSPRFTSTDTMGRTETAAQMIAEVSALKADPNKSSETTLLSVVPDGASVRVQQRYDMKTVKTGPDGAQHKVELVTLSTDSWIKSSDMWLIDSTVTDEMSYFSDGQLVAHKSRQ